MKRVYFPCFTIHSQSPSLSGVFLSCVKMYRPSMLTWLKWIGTVLGISGALIIALNLPISGWGFILFLGSSTMWLGAALIQRDTALAVLSAGYTAVNVLGIYRWLIV